MEIDSLCIEKKNILNVPKRTKSKSSMIKPLQRKSTRRKVGMEFDITRKDFDSPEMKFGYRTDISEQNSKAETNAISDITNEMADNLIKSIDTNIIAKLFNCSDEGTASKSVNQNSKIAKAQSKVCHQPLGNSLNNTVLCVEQAKLCENKAYGILKQTETRQEDNFTNNKTILHPKKRNRESVVELSKDSCFEGDEENANPSKKKRNLMKNKKESSNANLINSEHQIYNSNNAVNLKEPADVSLSRDKRFKNMNVLNTSINDTPDKNVGLKHFNVQDKQLNNLSKESILVENKKSKRQNIRKNQNLKVTKVTEKSIKVTRKSKRQTGKHNYIELSDLTDEEKSEKSQPKKRVRSQSAKGRVKKTRLKAKPETTKYIKLSKLTKNQIKNVMTKKIPKERFKDALDVIDNDDHPIWEEHNLSCNPYIYLHWKPRVSLVSDHNIKLKYAREFLLRRDWISLSKVLCLFNSTSKEYYPLMAKYATLLLAHTDKEQFDKFIQFLTSINDNSTVLKKCTKIPT